MNVASDFTIALMYLIIPLILLRVRYVLVDLIGRNILFSFAIFIVSCGMTHVMDIIVLWRPFYWAQAIVKFITAIASTSTVFLLVDLIRQKMKE